MNDSNTLASDAPALVVDGSADEQAVKRNGALRRTWRGLRLGLHLAEGLATVALAYRWMSPARQRRTKQVWSARMLGILGINLDFQGNRPPDGGLLVANHVSWIDIFVINAITPAAFVSKDDVLDWPLIGWLAARNETLFLRRGSRAHAIALNTEITRRLTDGRLVAVFPEGTTTDGRAVLPFHAALFQPAIDAGAPACPVALSYHLPDGRPCDAPAYIDDITLGQCIAAMLATPKIIARVRTSTPLHASARRALAEQSRQAVHRALGRTPGA